MSIYVRVKPEDVDRISLYDYLEEIKEDILADLNEVRGDNPDVSVNVLVTKSRDLRAMVNHLQATY